MDEESTGLRTALIREALSLLDEGATDLSLRRIARMARVSAMAPYRHFADKTALLRAVADHGFDLLRDTLEAADRSPGNAEALIAQGIAYVAFALRRPALFRLMFADHHPPDPCDHGDCRAAAYAVLSRRAARVTSNDGDVATLACWAIVHGLATLALDGRLSSDSEQIRSVLTLFVSSLETCQRS